MAADYLASSLGAPGFTKDKRGEWTAAGLETGDEKTEVLFYKPLEFMNLSGAGVRDFTKKRPVATDRVVVLHDEIELPFGEVKWKTGGGHKGHNGLRDLIAKCGGPDFQRVRIGVGRPDHDDVAEYVLSDFTPDEMAGMQSVLRECEKLFRDWAGKLLAVKR